jgi:uncharacterized protein YgbK (DUF1537 family)
MVRDWGQAHELITAVSQQSGLTFGLLRSLRRQVLLKVNAHNHRKLDAPRLVELSGRLGALSVIQMSTMYQHSPLAIAKALLKLQAGMKELQRAKALAALSAEDRILLDTASANDIVLSIDPRVDALRLAMATAFEGSLQNFLSEQSVAFRTEKEQHAAHVGEEALTSTPDILLDHPIEISGKRIHWIDGPTRLPALLVFSRAP